VRWVNVALGVVAFGLNVPVAPAVTIDHMPVPTDGVLPPRPAVVPPGGMSWFGPTIAGVGGCVMVISTSAVASAHGGFDTVHLRVITPVPPV
jgi:hypothetical protein